MPQSKVKERKVKESKLFDGWWDRYDKKEGRETALKSWNKLTEDEQTKCLTVVDQYVKAKPDKQYRPMPATYLNQKRFNDEITPAKPNPVSRYDQRPDVQLPRYSEVFGEH